MTNFTKRNGLSRRTLLKTGVAAAAGTLAAPMLWAQSNIVLRQTGTGVSAYNEIAKKAY
ncbi:MAG: ABC transporter substrate-binding protein, partial [Betaproteobacteria bacterium]|nr:ABC transporter substrate-binding protein [Betaproteobacteria bacterium]